MNDDLIKKSDAIEAVNKAEIWSEAHFVPDWDRARQYIDKLPSADRCLKEAEILLKATRNLLNKQEETIYVLNILEETVTYYGVECDGGCLMDDINDWLELYGSEEGTDNG